ncbi:restriction endonuclease subunit S [Clostridium perfringens]|uniref:restriction endonuclease subunit S n=1 Tax=Clostridium perfringens TaxID=1502 RepID=UPI0023F70428|nr:restriction endonuclease subunit S [Clostridium perfringens]MDK0689513.1 restriction endonuclease subunit S [Clostridium perfringens]MDM0786685.1 restriction endonuclease subunit S [Clostridium perfringens]MDM1016764.1 restriction endonuclease subunit S [Clostridium perfringens]WEV21772.1 restriction endonuclease subunit S [Clostridium perfringens D]
MKKEAREGYKITELGEIPNEWSVKKLKDIGYSVIGLTYSPDDLVEKENGILVLRSSNIKNSRISYDDNKYVNKVISEKQIVKKEDILICSRNGSKELIGKCAIIDEEAEGSSFGAFMTVFRSDYNKYLFHVFNSYLFKRQIYNNIGATINQITTDNLNNFKVIIPTNDEQEKISLILSTVDEQIDNTEKLIQKNQELKRGLMQQLLTKGIGHTEFKKTELGEIPKAWEIKKIEEICEILDSKRVPLNGKQRLKMQGDIPYYGANAIVDYINDYIFDDELILIAEDGGNFGEFREKPIAFYVKGKCWVNNHAHVLKAIECENSKWIFYNLVHKDITEIVQGGTRAKLNQKDLRNIKIPFPNLDEQEKIALILSSIDKKIEQYKYKKEKLEELKKGLMKQLLNGNIRVI